MTRSKLHFIDFQPILQIIAAIVEKWKAKILFFTRKFQLVSFTIWFHLAYEVRNFVLPEICIKMINSECFKFLYHDQFHTCKAHIVSWDNTCKPKNKGGLGLPSLATITFAFNYSILQRLMVFSNLLKS